MKCIVRKVERSYKIDPKALSFDSMGIIQVALSRSLSLITFITDRSTSALLHPTITSALHVTTSLSTSRSSSKTIEATMDQDLEGTSIGVMDRCTGLTDLPVYLIYRIVAILTDNRIRDGAIRSSDPESADPEFSFVLNHVRLGPSYGDLVSLSSTCIYLRKLLGPILFSNLSLVRSNQIDVILSTPRSLHEFSDSKTYHRQFFKEVLRTNLDDCIKSELAKTSFKNGVIGDTSFRCRYHTFNIANYVTYLECESGSLRGDDLTFFPNLVSLKVLGASILVPFEGTQQPLDHIRNLAINANTLIHYRRFTFPALTRLDLLLDFEDMDSGYGLGPIQDILLSSPIEELNFFIDVPQSIAIVEMVQMMKAMSEAPNRLKSFNVRLLNNSKPLNNSKAQWTVSEKGSAYVEILKSFEHLQSIVMDRAIVEVIDIDVSEVTSIEYIKPGLSFTVVDVASAVAQDKNYHKGLVAVVRALGIEEFRLQYGEIDNSYNRSYGIFWDIIQKIIGPHYLPYYGGLRKASIENCWSVSDDMFRRRYYMLDLDRLPPNDPQLRNKLAAASVWGRTKFNSPRYKKSAAYDVLHNPQEHDGVIRAMVDIKPTTEGINKFSASSSFWSVETSLNELEHYSLTARPSALQ